MTAMNDKKNFKNILKSKNHILCALGINSGYWNVECLKYFFASDKGGRKQLGLFIFFLVAIVYSVYL